MYFYFLIKEHGCCPDGKTKARGPDFRGCDNATPCKGGVISECIFNKPEMVFRPLSAMWGIRYFQNLRIFLEFFFGMFLEEFFGRNFLGGFYRRIFL